MDSGSGSAPWDVLSAALAQQPSVVTEPPPRSDDGSPAATVGEPIVLDGEVVLADYDAGWPNLYEREAERIRRILGARALRLEHVGSTSVPGLAAKPVVDILLVVPDAANEPAYASDLEREGYVLRIREPDEFEHRMFTGPDTDVNLHVYSPGAPEIERLVRFRDYLRTNDAERERYERRKRELASRPWRSIRHYADAKNGVVESILERADAAG